MKQVQSIQNISRIFAVIILLLFSTSTLSNNPLSEPLLEANDLAGLSEHMQEKNMPLLLAVQADHCGYCKRLNAEHLLPMNNNGDYLGRVIIRILHIDGTDNLKGFDGEDISPAALSDQYKANLTPTLLFLDHNGEEIAERLLGYNTPEYYGFYLDKAIDAASEKMKEE